MDIAQKLPNNGSRNGDSTSINIALMNHATKNLQN